MKKNIEGELKQMFTMTHNNPGVYTIKELASATNVATSTANKYAKEYRLPVKQRTNYDDHKIGFVQQNASLMSREEVAQQLNLELWQVDYLRIKAGRVSFKKGNGKQAITQEIIDRVTGMVEDGYSIRDAANANRVAYSTAWRIVNGFLTIEKNNIDKEEAETGFFQHDKFYMY